MPNQYPWPTPPEHEELIVRLHPGEERGDIAVLEWEGEVFARVRPADSRERRLVHEDPSIFAAPGLLDVQINGYWGREFKDADLGPEGIRDLCWSILLSGTTRFMPTVTTDALETMHAAMANIDAACRAYPDVASMVAGIHQEGPWISPLDGPRGAHPAEHVALPDLEVLSWLQEGSGNRIAMLTLAPELEEATDLIREAVLQGLVVCLGHHNADRQTIQLAVEAGARCVTHLGNGCMPIMPRHPNVLWTQAAEDRLYAGVICDGHHLPPETVRVLYRAKPHDKLILVSDAVRMAGAPPGLYRFQDAIAQLKSSGWYGFYGMPLLIGAAVPLARCLANLAVFADDGKAPGDYWQHATEVPGRLVALPGTSSSLGKAGTPATFIIWRWERDVPNLLPQRIVVRGRTVYDSQMLQTEVPFGHALDHVTLEQAERWLAEHRLVSQ